MAQTALHVASGVASWAPQGLALESPRVPAPASHRRPAMGKPAIFLVVKIMVQYGTI